MLFNNFSQYVSQPLTAHWDDLVYVLRYLKRTTTVGLLYPKNNSFQLAGLCDIEWGFCIDTRYSLIDFVFTVGRPKITILSLGLIMTLSVKQWHPNIWTELNNLFIQVSWLKVSCPTSLWCINQPYTLLLIQFFMKEPNT